MEPPQEPTLEEVELHQIPTDTNEEENYDEIVGESENAHIGQEMGADFRQRNTIEQKEDTEETEEADAQANADAEGETETALQPGWNPLHHLKLAYLLFRDARRIRSYRLGKNINRRVAIREVGKWVVSTAIWLPLFVYSLFLPNSSKLTPLVIHSLLGYFEIPFFEISNPITVRLFIAPAWIWGGLFGARRGRKSQILFGAPSAIIAFIVTDYIVGSLPRHVAFCAIAAGVLAITGGIALGMARITRCQAAMAYTLAVCFVEMVVIASTAALDMNGGKEFTAAAAFTMISTATVWVLTKLFCASTKHLRDLGEIITVFVFSGTWIGSFLKAALSAKGDLLWAGGAALIVVLIAFVGFLRGVYYFIRIYEDDEELERDERRRKRSMAMARNGENEGEGVGVGRIGGADRGINVNDDDDDDGNDDDSEYEYVFEEGWNGVLMDTSSEEEDSDGEYDDGDDDIDAEDEDEALLSRGRHGLRPLADSTSTHAHTHANRPRRLSNPFPIVSSASVWPRAPKEVKAKASEDGDGDAAKE